ncbi:MAG: hypothetical protein AM326_02575 [Candidatus Thorarchaeota archaeon SMTZ-45]|nr:MAG: hypothetical protein AM326_02575 [Candidatus Thorarchaeota archaeon SMTZ-45]
MGTAKFMSLHRKWIFNLAGLVCIALAIVGGLTYPSSSWGILAPILYVSVVVLCTLGMLRLIYLKGLPD